MNTAERRSEKRLRYSWPIWFGHDFDDELTQGQLVDLSSRGVAFTCYADRCPYPGDRITARFSVPRYGPNWSFNLENCVRDGRICRVEEINPYVRRIAVQFAEPLPFHPGEDTDTEQQEQEQATPATWTLVGA